MIHYANAVIKRVIHYNPIILPLRAKEYISNDPIDAVFGALSYTNLLGLTHPSRYPNTKQNISPQP